MLHSSSVRSSVSTFPLTLLPYTIPRAPTNANGDALQAPDAPGQSALPSRLDSALSDLRTAATKPWAANMVHAAAPKGQGASGSMRKAVEDLNYDQMGEGGRGRDVRYQITLHKATGAYLVLGQERMDVEQGCAELKVGVDRAESAGGLTRGVALTQLIALCTDCRKPSAWAGTNALMLTAIAVWCRACPDWWRCTPAVWVNRARRSLALA